MKINLKKLFVTAVIGAGLFVSQPAYSALTIEFGYDSYLYTNAEKRISDYYKNKKKKANSNKNNSSSKNKGSSKSTSSSSSKTAETPKKAKITFKSDGSTRGLDDLVNNYPSKQRAEAKVYLKKLQDSFPQVARSVGIPTNDLSTGMSALIAGAYMAYNNVSLNDNYMKPLQKQFKEAFESISDYDKMSDSDKKYVYDQMVIIGMTLAVNQSQNQQNPNAKTTAQLRQAGKKVLEGMFGVNASEVRITASGLSF